jgi:hypothetical protein
MSDVSLTLQNAAGVYLAITETPAVVTLSAAVISGASGGGEITGTVTANCRSDIYDGINHVYYNKSIIAWGNPFLGEPSLVEESTPLPISGTVTANTYTGQFVRVNTTGNVGGSWLLERVSETFWKNRDDANEGATISYLPNSYIWEFQSGEGAVAWNGNAYNSIPPSDGWQGLVEIATITVTPENPYQISGTVTASLFNAQAELGENAPSQAVQIGGYNLADNKIYPFNVDSNGIQKVEARPLQSSSTSITTFTETTSSTVLAPDATRKGIVFYVSGAGSAFISLGNVETSTTAYSIVVSENDVANIAGYTGDITGLVTGDAVLHITELS